MMITSWQKCEIVKSSEHHSDAMNSKKQFVEFNVNVKMPFEAP